jgi:hypothetical protein
MTLAESSTDDAFFAYAYRDIFDKKVAQKLLRFFLYGFPDVPKMAQSWAIAPKDNGEAFFPRLFSQSDSKTEIHVAVEDYLLDKFSPLKHLQCTCEWFTLRAFYLTATMSAKIIYSTMELNNTTMLEMLMSLWFTRTRSTREMIIRMKNESAVLTAFSRNNDMEQVFKCGLLKCLNLPWLAALPDAVAVLNVAAGQIIAAVEVKTRVSADRIASEEQVAANLCKILI